MANNEGYEGMGEPFFEEEPDEVELTPEEFGELQALAQSEDVTPPEEQILPEEAAVTDPMQLILIAINGRRHLQIEYTNRHGETKLYVGEPYEIGGAGSHPAGYLWMYDINADTIKSFFLSNISDVQLLTTIFVPRF